MATFLGGGPRALKAHVYWRGYYSLVEEDVEPRGTSRKYALALQFSRTVLNTEKYKL